MLERNKTRQKTAGSVRTRRTGMPFLYFIAAGILSCAQITGVGSPFGVAFAAAACRTGYGVGAVLGTFAGYLLHTKKPMQPPRRAAETMPIPKAL